MKFQLKSCVTFCLLTAATQAFAAQIPCPTPQTVALYADNIDTIQSIGWGSFVLITGSDLFASPFYDDESDRNWRLVTLFATEKGSFNTAFKEGKKIAKSVTVSLNKYAEQQQDGFYTCGYGNGDQDVKVFAFTPVNDKAVTANLIKSLFRRV